ncbi:hypothetical protein ACFY7Z_02290 [Streptomyces sp. NPDC012623]|uniref:hypothetical protein n=1 Tax=unclassified Streptomyces TaxID=2593676 RepID=UPI0036C48F9C
MGVRIRRAGEDDRATLVRLCEEAFYDAPVSTWVLPDDEHRRKVNGLFLGVFADAALAEGRVDLTGAAHPEERPHEYRLMVAVSPAHQGRGPGRALIEHSPRIPRALPEHSPGAV